MAGERSSLTGKQPLTVGGVDLRIELNEGKLVSVDLPPQPPATLDAAGLEDIRTALGRYELCLEGVPEFTRRVWEALKSIPAGTALTYRELAAAAGNPKAIRAAGGACGANRFPILIPCHRVLAEDGLGGFSAGLAWKIKLLELEAIC